MLRSDADELPRGERGCSCFGTDALGETGEEDSNEVDCCFLERAEGLNWPHFGHVY